MDQSNDVYIQQMIDLLVPYGTRPTVRGFQDIAYLEEYGEVTVALRWIMDPPGSNTLTYAQSGEALGYLMDLLDDDLSTSEALNHEVAVEIYVGRDKKIVVSVTQDNGDQHYTTAGSALELNAQTYRARSISRSGTAASLAAATAEYRSLAAAVPEGFAQTIIQSGVRYELSMELEEHEPVWPYFTFADLVDVAGAVQHLLETADAPSADSWGALFASIETQEDGITIGYVHVEPLSPGVNLLNSNHTDQATLSRPGNSSVGSQVDVT